MSTDMKVYYKLDDHDAGSVLLQRGSTVEDLRRAVKIAEEANLVGVGYNNLTVYDPKGETKLVSFTPMEDDPSHLKVYVVKTPRVTLRQNDAAPRHSDVRPVIARELSNELKDQQSQADVSLLAISKQEPQLSEQAMAGLELMAKDYVAKKRTIVLSEATFAAKSDLMDMLHIPEKGASWPNKPAVLQHVDGFSWLKGDEDCVENRTAYMAYLNNILQIPACYALADTQPNRKLLTVELLREMPESRKISGTTDVAIAKSEHVRNEAIRNNIETLLELKAPKNFRKKDHSPQTIGEHFAASYLNPDHAVVSVLTDLNQKWTLFWFARGEGHSKMALYKLCLNGGEAAAAAKFLLDSLYDESVSDTLPTTFANRQPFQAVLSSVVKNKRVRREVEDDDSHSPNQDSKPSPSGGADQHPPSGTDAGSSSRSGCTAHQINQGATDGGGGAPMSMTSVLSLFAPPADRDIANELDLIDMVDESEQYEIVRSFASKHIVPYMTG